MFRERPVVPISKPTMIVISTWFWAGASLIVGRIYGVDVNPAMTSTVVNQQLVLGLLLMLGSALMIASGFTWRRLSTVWRLELWGLPILNAGFILYTISVAFPPKWAEQTPAAFPIIIGIGFTAATTLRLWDVILVIRSKRRQIKTLPPEVRDA